MCSFIFANSSKKSHPLISGISMSRNNTVGICLLPSPYSDEINFNPSAGNSKHLISALLSTLPIIQLKSILLIGSSSTIIIFGFIGIICFLWFLLLLELPQTTFSKLLQWRQLVTRYRDKPMSHVLVFLVFIGKEAKVKSAALFNCYRTLEISYIIH